MPTMPRRAFSVLILSIPLLLTGGCKKPVEAPAAGSLTVVQGDLQVAASGTVLPTQLILRVRGTDGAPLSDVPISFQVTQGGGAVDPATANSDANGEVKVKWTLGSGAQAQSLNAAVPGLDPITLNATGVVPDNLVIVQGNNQSAKAGAQLSVPIIVRVTGGTNIPIPGVTVSFALSGGSVSPASATTNALGEVSVRWTMGAQAGPQTAQASALALTAVTINATAN